MVPSQTLPFSQVFAAGGGWHSNWQLPLQPEPTVFWPAPLSHCSVPPLATVSIKGSPQTEFTQTAELLQILRGLEPHGVRGARSAGLLHSMPAPPATATQASVPLQGLPSEQVAGATGQLNRQPVVHPEPGVPFVAVPLSHCSPDSTTPFPQVDGTQVPF